MNTEQTKIGFTKTNMDVFFLKKHIFDIIGTRK